MSTVEPVVVSADIGADVLEDGCTSPVSDDDVKLYRIPLEDFSEDLSDGAVGSSSDVTSAPPLSMWWRSSVEKVYIGSDDELSIDKASTIVGNSLGVRLVKVIFGKKLHIDRLATSEVFRPYFLIFWRVFLSILAFTAIGLCIVYIKHPCCLLAPITYGILVLSLLRVSVLAFKRSKIQHPRMLDYERPKRVEYR